MGKEKLKILQAVYCLGRGGAEKLALDITRELATRAEVEVLLVSFDKTADLEYSTSGINYKFCPSSVALSPMRPNRYALDNYISLLNEFQPDIIHSHRYMAEIVTRSYLLKKATYFTHCHDNMQPFASFGPSTLFSKLKMLDYYERSYLFKRYRKSGGNNFICISDYTSQYFNAVLPPKLRNITLLHNAICFEKYNAVNHERPIKELKLISVGSIEEKKQVLLIDMMQQLKLRGVYATLTLLGDGTYMEIVKERVRQHGLEDRIKFEGVVYNVEDYLKEANLYVHSAYIEPFGLVLLEAMAAGLPVVALNGQGNSDIMRDGENGFLIPEQNAVLFAGKVMEIMSNESLYRAMSKRAVEFARGFDIKQYVDRLLNLYKQKKAV